MISSFNTAPIKILLAGLVVVAEIVGQILKFIWKYKGPRIPKIILKNTGKVGGLILPDFTTYYKAAVIRAGSIVTGWEGNRL